MSWDSKAAAWILATLLSVLVWMVLVSLAGLVLILSNLFGERVLFFVAVTAATAVAIRHTVLRD